MGSGRIFAMLVVLTSCGRAAPKVATSPGCPSHLRLQLGACVSPAIAAQACGASAIATLDGCVPRPPCEPGRARDLASGDCLPRRDTRAIATSLGILVAEDELLACPGGGQLATGTVEEAPAGPRIGCLPALPSPRHPPCPVGELPGAAVDRVNELCIRFAEGGRIDVVRWLRVVIGPDGGAGAAPLCGALEQSPGALGSGPGEVRAAVAVVFPDNDVTQVSAEIHGSGASPSELEHVLAPIIEALRSLGGTASQASIATAVRCHRISGRPASGGREPSERGLGEAAEPPEIR